MTKEEILDKYLTTMLNRTPESFNSLNDLKQQPEYRALLDAMDEYGKQEKNSCLVKNLENSEILSDEMLESIEIIVSNIPNVVFGGSIALNAAGLINRKILDIDFFTKLDYELPEPTFFKPQNNKEILSESTTDVNGNLVKRIGIVVGNVNVCCFKISDDELNHTQHSFNRNGKNYTINIQNIIHAIEAKISYSDKNPKHKQDLNNISNWIDELLK